MKYSYVDEDTGEVIWNNDNLSKYLKCFNYRDVYATKKLDTNNNKLFDVKILPNDKNSKNHKTKAKVAVNKNRSNINKYGGFNTLKNDIVAVERRKNNKIERKLVNLPIMLRNSSNEEKCKFLLENGKYDSVKIIKYLKNNQLIEIDKTFYYLGSATELDTAYQLILSKKDTETLYHINESIKNNDFTILMIKRNS